MLADPASTTAAAVDLAGLAVFPIPPGGRWPAAGGWHARCLSVPACVRDTWRAGDNVAVGCRASRVAGLDLDLAGDGPAVLAALAARLGAEWPDTLTVQTPRGVPLSVSQSELMRLLESLVRC